MNKTSNEILFVPASKYFLENKFFSPEPDPSNARTTNNFWHLKQHFSKLGYNMKTIDLSKNIRSAKAIIFMEMPQESNSHYKFCIDNNLLEKTYLVTLEPHSIHLPNHDPSRHERFKRILTWNNDLVDNKRYIKLFYTIPIHFGERVEIPRAPFKEKKLACMINSNKFSSYPKQLYSERVRAIKFMEKNHPEKFDLFGFGWDFPILYNGPANDLKINAVILKVWSVFPKMFRTKQYPSFVGLGYKHEILPHYKFTFAYENQEGGNGYISEKILESFLFGCVPIYLGDPNIGKLIPTDCFLDKRNYPSYDLLYNKLASTDEREHSNYLNNIEDFLNSENIYPFTTDSFISSFEKLLNITE